MRNSMLRRGGDKTLRWVLTQFPTEAYAREAGMNFADYEDFVYGACHADDKRKTRWHTGSRSASSRRK